MHKVRCIYNEMQKVFLYYFMIQKESCGHRRLNRADLWAIVTIIKLNKHIEVGVSFY